MVRIFLTIKSGNWLLCWHYFYFLSFFAEKLIGLQLCVKRMEKFRAWVSVYRIKQLPSLLPGLHVVNTTTVVCPAATDIQHHHSYTAAAGCQLVVPWGSHSLHLSTTKTLNICTSKLKENTLCIDPKSTTDEEEVRCTDKTSPDSNPASLIVIHASGFF